MKKLHVILKVTAFLLILVSACSFSSCKTKKEFRPLQIDLLKVGKADAIVLHSAGHALVIDAGEEDDGLALVKFLRKEKILQVDALIITHYDRDHVGGADILIENMKVQQIYVPDYEGTHAEYLEFMEAVKKAKVPLLPLNKDCSFDFMDAKVTIEAPASYDTTGLVSKDYDNNFSLITTVVHGKNRMVFMGDAEKKRIHEWLKSPQAQPCDFLKVPHHGIYNSGLEQLFKILQPKGAAICSSNKNPAEKKTLRLLSQYAKEIYETKDGQITVFSDGKTLSYTQHSK